MKIWQWTLATCVAAITGVFTMMAYAHSTFVSKDMLNVHLTRIEAKVDLIREYYGLKFKEDKWKK